MKKSNDLNTKENNKLRDEISKLEKVQIQRSNIIDDFVKSDKDSSTLPKILQDVRKRYNKARTFALPDNNNEEEEALALSYLTKLEVPKHVKENTLGKYESINLNRVDNLIDELKDNITISDNVVDLGDNKNIYFRDLLDFLSDIKNNKINNFNKEEEYKRRLVNTEDKLINRKKIVLILTFI